ncbi:Phosphoglycolate phosphatase [Andreprevotia sp. IGB-42]|uniref:pyrimidine 5'-nucleotidase n=1 Tax=Andreprevotia sp. IGB-42 TaxID=2497473 RepID=UPI00135A163E|nr:pyrimidine 5'-nucleotidase [Andreprevotia sp. IGB-42]KAF0814576.1 Phosphoglycolate phosphatase [Andreprevotia sp. IGB-42]
MRKPARSTRQPVWLFDLDNTLHDASRHAFPTIDGAMTQFIAEALAIQADAASHLRVHYWQRYGATILGLLRHHPHIDPRHFLAHSHPLTELLQAVYPMKGLKRTLQQLPGRKILFTNGPQLYAQAMLNALGVAAHFDGIFSVDRARGYVPKPQMRTYRQLLRHFRLQASDCILVEDSRDNLQPARRLGMRTIWIKRGVRGSAWADHTIRQLADLRTRRCS